MPGESGGQVIPRVHASPAVDTIVLGEGSLFAPRLPVGFWPNAGASPLTFIKDARPGLEQLAFLGEGDIPYQMLDTQEPPPRPEGARRVRGAGRPREPSG
jgi:hypothetical protein